MDSDAKNYTPWTIRKSEREFFQSILGYIDEIIDHANILSTEVEKFTSGDFDGLRVAHGLMSQRSCDLSGYRRELILRLEESSVTPENRGYLNRIIFSISAVSSYIHSASSRLNLRDVRVSDSVSSSILDMMEKTMSMFNLFRQSIVFMNEDLMAAVDKTCEIDCLENEIDEIRRSALKAVLNDPSYTSPADLHVIVEVLGSLETISDKIDAAAEQLELVAIAHLS